MAKITFGIPLNAVFNSVVVIGGSVTGGVTGLTLNAGGANQNITLTPSGTGITTTASPISIGISTNTDSVLATIVNTSATGGAGLSIVRANGATGGPRAAFINFNSQWYAGILRSLGNGTNVFSIGTGLDAGATTPNISLISGSPNAASIFGRLVTNTSNVSVPAWGVAGLSLNGGGYTGTDTSTAPSGTATLATFYSFYAPTLAATNTGVTTTTAATVYINGSPIAGTNQTITQSYGLYVAAGNTYLGGNLNVGGIITTTSAGSTLLVKSGTNAKAGTFTLTAGTVTVANTSVDANSVIIITLKTVGGTRNGLPDIVPTSGVGFVATAVSTDTSTYNYVILEVN